METHRDAECAPRCTHDGWTDQSVGFCWVAMAGERITTSLPDDEGEAEKRGALWQTAGHGGELHHCHVEIRQILYFFSTIV